jgi:hypothetical protein
MAIAAAPTRITIVQNVSIFAPFPVTAQFAFPEFISSQAGT